MRFLIILFVFALTSCECVDEVDCGVTKLDDFALIDSIVQEPECSSQGGMCVIASDCSGPLTKQTGLCPKQQNKGVECCQGRSKKETRCQKVGGVCLPMDSLCNERIVFKQATDCQKQKCCIMVN